MELNWYTWYTMELSWHTVAIVKITTIAPSPIGATITSPPHPYQDSQWFKEKAALGQDGEVFMLPIESSCMPCGLAREVYCLKTDEAFEDSYENDAAFKAEYDGIAKSYRLKLQKKEESGSTIDTIPRQAVESDNEFLQDMSAALAFVPLDLANARLRKDCKKIATVLSMVSKGKCPWTGKEYDGFYLAPHTLPPNLPYWISTFKCRSVVRMRETILGNDDIMRADHATDLHTYTQRQAHAAKPAQLKGTAILAPTSWAAVVNKVQEHDTKVKNLELQARAQNEANDRVASGGSGLLASGLGEVRCGGRLGRAAAVAAAATIQTQKPAPKPKAKVGPRAQGDGSGSSKGQGRGSGSASAGGKGYVTPQRPGRSNQSESGLGSREGECVVGSAAGPEDFGMEEQEGNDPLKEPRMFDLAAIQQGAAPGHKERWVRNLASLSFVEFENDLQQVMSPGMIGHSDFCCTKANI